MIYCTVYVYTVLCMYILYCVCIYIRRGVRTYSVLYVLSIFCLSTVYVWVRSVPTNIHDIVVEDIVNCVICHVNILSH